jgi:GT2 family glycosyltransferase
MVSIVIPVRNMRILTQQCINAIRENTTDIDYEIIVVDDGSRPKTRDWLKTLHVDKLIRHDTPQGFPKSVNDGWKIAKGEYLCTVNNDTIPGPGWLNALLETLAEENVGVTGRFGGFIRPDYVCYKQEHTWKREVDYIEGSCWIYPRSVYNAVGNFDESFGLGYCEDTDLSIRIRRAGYRVVSTPNCNMVHLGAQTTSVLVTDFDSRLAHNLKLLLAKYGPWESVEQTHLPVTLFCPTNPPVMAVEHIREYNEQWGLVNPPPRRVVWQNVIVADKVDPELAPTDWIFWLKENERLTQRFLNGLHTLISPDKEAWMLKTMSGEEIRLWRKSKVVWKDDRIERTLSGQCDIVLDTSIMTGEAENATCV